MNIINCIKKLKVKEYDHPFTCKTGCVKIQHLIMIKVLERLGIQGTYLQKIKTIHSKLIAANIKIHGENLKAIPLKLGTRQVCLLYVQRFNTVLEALSTAIRHMKEIK